MAWNALNNAATAMQAMTWGLGTISQNVANVNTTAYKVKETLFQTMLSGTHATPSSSSAGFDGFGVQTADRNLISKQGVVTPTNSWSDLAINGSGFFIVTSPTNSGAPASTVSFDNTHEVFYTRDGSLRQLSAADGRNYFVTGGGLYLMGWQADAHGNIPGVRTTASSGGGNMSVGGATAAGATPPLVPVYTMPTTTIPGLATTAAMISANVPQNTGVTPSTQLKGFELLHNSERYQFEVNWVRDGASGWIGTITAPAGVTFADGQNTATVTMTMDGFGNVTPATQALDIVWPDAATETLDYTLPNPTLQTQKLTVPIYDSAFNRQILTTIWEHAGANTWNVFFGTPDGTSSTAPIQVSFDGDGQLISPTDNTQVDLSWTTGTPPATTTASIALDLSQMTQYKGDLQIYSTDQNGYGNGVLTNAVFNQYGELIGSFDNGQQRTLFKVPVINFVAQDRLDPVSGNLFRRTPEAGDFRITSIEDAPGQSVIIGGALEQSGVDIEDQFTRMIMTQKAYSTNATVFKTADEMTTTARDLM